MNQRISDAWNQIPTRFHAALLHLGFNQPTPIQSAALPSSLQGESVIALAPTGTGKTLVYLLPLWQAAVQEKPCLVLVPTRELAYQVSQMLQALEPNLRQEIVLALGGHDLEAQLDDVRRPWSILIATPGRLIDLLNRLPNLLKNLQLLVLDEFDRLIDMGFSEQVQTILAKIPTRPQRLLFSATDLPESLQQMGFDGITKITLARPTEGYGLTESIYLLKSIKKKGPLLLEALVSIPTKSQALIFVNNIAKANHLHGLMKLKGLQALLLHGHQPQTQRAHSFQEFREGKAPILVATDLAARGLDLPQVELIVNYDLPRTFKDYVHRSGRTARRGRQGHCMSFAGPEDWLLLRNLTEGWQGSLPFAPGYDHLEMWSKHAKRVHDAKVEKEKRGDSIRKQQGLDEHN